MKRHEEVFCFFVYVFACCTLPVQHGLCVFFVSESFLDVKLYKLMVNFVIVYWAWGVVCLTSPESESF